jgi:hypothetical protein
MRHVYKTPAFNGWSDCHTFTIVRLTIVAAQARFNQLSCQWRASFFVGIARSYAKGANCILDLFSCKLLFNLAL